MEILELIQIGFMVLTIVFVIVALEYNDIIYSLVAYAAASVSLGILFLFLGVVYVALIQFSVLAGAIVVLALATLGMIGDHDERFDEPKK